MCLLILKINFVPEADTTTEESFSAHFSSDGSNGEDTESSAANGNSLQGAYSMH